MTDQEIQKRLDFIRANCELEGITPTAENEENAKLIMLGKKSADEVVREYEKDLSYPEPRAL